MYPSSDWIPSTHNACSVLWLTHILSLQCEASDLVTYHMISWFFCPDVFIYFDHDFHLPHILIGFCHLPTKLYALSLSKNTQQLKVKKNQFVKCVQMFNVQHFSYTWLKNRSRRLIPPIDCNFPPWPSSHHLRWSPGSSHNTGNQAKFVCLCLDDVA